MFLGMSSSLHSFISLMTATQNPRCPDPGGGVDALIGRTQATSEVNPACDGRQRWWNARDRSWNDFRMTDFVTTRGGEYFFVPSVRFLKHVRDLAKGKPEDGKPAKGKFSGRKPAKEKASKLTKRHAHRRSTRRGGKA